MFLYTFQPASKAPAKNAEKDVPLPLDKKRELPKWMVGSSNRVDMSPTKDSSPNKDKTGRKEQPSI